MDAAADLRKDNQTLKFVMFEYSKYPIDTFIFKYPKDNSNDIKWLFKVQQVRVIASHNKLWFFLGVQ